MADWLNRATPVEEAPASGWASRATPVGEDDEALVANYLDQQEKYGSAGQQAIAFLEGAGAAATFGLSTAAETAIGVDPEGIRGRREANPMSHAAGQVAGLGASLLVPVAGAGNIIARSGQLGARAVGLGAAESTLAKIGSSAVKAAVENMVFQAGDEASKAFAGNYQNPYEGVETALTNIGISGLIGGGVGGGLGSISPLWKATAGGKVGQILESIKNKAGGIDNTIDDAVHGATQRMGLDLSPEVKSRLSNDPWVQSAAKGLEQSDTTATGRGFQEKMKTFRGELDKSILESMGHTPESVHSVEHLSKNAAGKEIGDTLANEVSEKLNPIGKEFDALESKYGHTELVPDRTEMVQTTSPDGLFGSRQKQVIPGTASELFDRIEQKVIENNWNTFEDADVLALINGVRKRLPQTKTVQQLTDLISTVGEKANKNFMNRELSRAGQVIKGVLQQGKDDLLIAKLGQEAPELVEKFAATKQAWREQANLVEQLKDRLGIKGTTSGFAKNLKEMLKGDAEAVVNKLSGKGDADLLKLLQEQFPGTAEAVRKYQRDSILKTALDKAKPGEVINTAKLLNSIKALGKDGPELLDFTFSPEVLQRVDDVGALLDQLNKAPHNFSNTARTMDKLFEYVPATAVGMASMISGGNPVIAGGMAMLTKFLSKDAPDAAKLAILKFMASGQPLESGALKSATDVIEQTLKGEAAVTKGVRAVFKSSREVLPSKSNRISENEREKLDKRVLALSANPESLLDMGGDAGYYLPEHATVMAETAGRVVSYLKTVRPDVEPKSPLDPKFKASAVQKAQYNRALDIAESPLIVLNDVKSGTLTLNDVKSLNAMYPALYQKLSRKFMEEIADQKEREEPIPYKTRMSLSLFLAQPLDSTLLPMAIQSNQPPAPEMQQPAPYATSMKKVDKIASMAATPSQARELKSLQS